jgi:hypothetical protein
MVILRQSSGIFKYPFCDRLRGMSRRKNLDLAKIHASLSVVCSHCSAIVEPGKTSARGWEENGLSVVWGDLHSKERQTEWSRRAGSMSVMAMLRPLAFYRLSLIRSFHGRKVFAKEIKVSATLNYGDVVGVIGGGVRHEGVTGQLRNSTSAPQ